MTNLHTEIAVIRAEVARHDAWANAHGWQVAPPAPRVSVRLALAAALHALADRLAAREATPSPTVAYDEGSIA